jgi:hypothetical protein
MSLRAVFAKQSKRRPPILVFVDGLHSSSRAPFVDGYSRGKSKNRRGIERTGLKPPASLRSSPSSLEPGPPPEGVS